MRSGNFDSCPNAACRAISANNIYKNLINRPRVFLLCCSSLTTRTAPRISSQILCGVSARTTLALSGTALVRNEARHRNVPAHVLTFGAMATTSCREPSAVAIPGRWTRPAAGCAFAVCIAQRCSLEALQTGIAADVVDARAYFGL